MNITIEHDRENSTIFVFFKTPESSYGPAAFSYGEDELQDAVEDVRTYVMGARDALLAHHALHPCTLDGVYKTYTDLAKIANERD